LSIPRQWTQRFEQWAPLAGLAATAWLVLPRGGHDLPVRIFQGCVVGTLALGWSAIVVVLLRLVVHHLTAAEVAPTNFRAASAGIWFAPAILLPLTPAGIGAAVVLAMGAARLLCTLTETADWTASSSRSMLETGSLALDVRPRHRIPSLAVAAGLQGAVTMMLLDHWATSAGLLSISVAILTAIAIALGAWTESRPPNLPRSVVGLGLTFLLAMGAGQYRGGGNGSGWGFGAGSGTALWFGDKSSQDAMSGAKPSSPEAPLPSLAPPPGATGEVTPDPRFSGVDVPGSFPGVILWPEVNPQVTLVAPYPTLRAGRGPGLQRPFVIPFGGEYWMYRWPFARPPRDSYFRRGSPAKMAFSTTDRTALKMEALEKLDRSISMSCCSRIQVVVQNADWLARATALELIAIDNDPPFKPPLSLGTARPQSAPHKTGDTTVPVSETLDFPVPPEPRLAKFDELKVVYRRDGAQQAHSSRIAIERFILVP